MMLYGWREHKIDLQPITNHSCIYCNTPNSIYIQTNRTYIHVFWIPFLPLHKTVYSICSNCKQTLSKNEMPPDLQQKAHTLSKNTKTPIWFYIGLVILFLMFIGVITSSII